jgi:hypothetical protein
MIGRRRFVLTSLAGALTAPLAAGAQQPAKMPRVGYLGFGVPGSDPSGIAGLRQGLRELGYVEHQNIIVEYRYDPLVRLGTASISSRSAPPKLGVPAGAPR